MRFLTINFALQPNWEERKTDWPYKRPSVVVDTLVAQTWSPSLEEWKYVNKKRCRRSFLLYQVAVSLGSLRIVSFDGPFKGAAADSSIMKTTIEQRLIDDDELALADKWKLEKVVHLSSTW